ncbi:MULTISPECIES: SDR family oxidoreductase [unclassified Lentimicrobium]|uniref:SDR family oxidoreductase n=1 Tax=unclassified Lentimicrobium TaxID=2677434 RepID=UPI0015527700|nr:MULTISPECIES: SDR family oxidoreductase [unclassified Lentimicrobium]NPD44868.1 DUF2867 domain-containing protein [Lentimicrobium sp. S6]NPD83694.1 DUF2867 domain-containing protein [Lentimicrobium sp. L6]
MRVLLTGVTGYVGKRLLVVLIDMGFDVVCAVRDKRRLKVSVNILNKIEIVEVDFLNNESLKSIPSNIDAAYYLIHSMASSTKKFSELESACARNFKDYMNEIQVKQVIYLSGLITKQEDTSEHLASRKNVEDILLSGNYKSTVLRAGIIVGSGSASFEIIRDIVEKLPIMVTPKWVLTKSQPIAIRDIVTYLSRVLFNEACMNHSYDIGGPEVLTYKDMLLQYADARGLDRRIITLPIMTPKVSSFWLYFITSTSYRLATNLVQSMKYEVVCQNTELEKLLSIKPISYRKAIEYAFLNIKQNMVTSSWKDSIHDEQLSHKLSEFIEVPAYGCYVDRKSIKVEQIEEVMNNIWSIGGEKGWYYATWLWELRGHFDKLLGGVGLGRGRKHPTQVFQGESIDFWRVLVSNREERRLLLYAEMKLPGEAWMEFKIDKDDILHQVATFRPKGVLGRAYWGMTMPFHFFIFNGMIRNIAKVG